MVMQSNPRGMALHVVRPTRWGLLFHSGRFATLGITFLAKRPESRLGHNVPALFFPPNANGALNCDGAVSWGGEAYGADF